MAPGDFVSLLKAKRTHSRKGKFANRERTPQNPKKEQSLCSGKRFVTQNHNNTEKYGCVLVDKKIPAMCSFRHWATIYSRDGEFCARWFIHLRKLAQKKKKHERKKVKKKKLQHQRRKNIKKRLSQRFSFLDDTFEPIFNNPQPQPPFSFIKNLTVDFLVKRLL